MLSLTSASMSFSEETRVWREGGRERREGGKGGGREGGREGEEGEEGGREGGRGAVNHSHYTSHVYTCMCKQTKQMETVLIINCARRTVIGMPVHVHSDAVATQPEEVTALVALCVYLVWSVYGGTELQHLLQSGLVLSGIVQQLLQRVLPALLEGGRCEGVRV